MILGLSKAVDFIKLFVFGFAIALCQNEGPGRGHASCRKMFAVTELKKGAEEVSHPGH